MATVFLWIVWALVITSIAIVAFMAIVTVGAMWWLIREVTKTMDKL